MDEEKLNELYDRYEDLKDKKGRRSVTDSNALRLLQQKLIDVESSRADWKKRKAEKKIQKEERREAIRAEQNKELIGDLSKTISEHQELINEFRAIPEPTSDMVRMQADIMDAKSMCEKRLKELINAKEKKGLLYRLFTKIGKTKGLDTKNKKAGKEEAKNPDTFTPISDMEIKEPEKAVGMPIAPTPIEINPVPEKAKENVNEYIHPIDIKPVNEAVTTSNATTNDKPTGEPTVEEKTNFITGWVAQQAELKNENKSLKADNIAKTLENKSLKEENDTLKAKNADLQQANDGLKKENDNIKAELAQKTAMYDKLTKEMNEMDAEYKRQLDRLGKENLSLKTDIEKLNNENSNLKADIEALKKYKEYFDKIYTAASMQSEVPGRSK